MISLRSHKDVLIALAGACVTSLALLIVSLYSLWNIETDRLQLSRNIAQLAEISAPALAISLTAADYTAIETIAAAIKSSPEIEKLEIRDRTGALELALADENIDGSLASLTRPLLADPASGDEQIGLIRLYFSNRTAAGVGFWLMSIAALVATIFLFWVTWRLARTFGPRPAPKSVQPRETAGMPGDDSGLLPKGIFSISQKETAPPFGHLFESETHMASLISDEGRLVAASAAWLARGGYRREAVSGADIADFIVDPDRDMITKRLADMRTERRPQKGTLRFRHADGTASDVWFAATAVSTPEGETFTLAVTQDISELTGLSGKPVTAEFSDYLTGLANRVGFEKMLASLVSDAAPESSLACLVIDLDRFKSINDHHGYSAGEELLRAFVKRSNQALQKAALSARLGGDEFAIAVVGPDAAITARSIADAVHATTAEPFLVGPAAITVTASIGIAHFPEDAADADDLIRFAAIAATSRKAEGGNGIRVFEPQMLASRKKRTETEADILRGVEENLFEPSFQPITCLASGQIIGFEALMRLNHPEKGLIPPGEFIAVAEETKWIDHAGRQLFSKALSGLCALSRKRGDDRLHITVNLSPVQLTPDKVAFMERELAAYGIDASRLTVEITEAVFMEDNDRISESLRRLKEMGCRIALDDFGTGYSSLAYLTRFHVDTIKIDQTFTKGLTHSDPALAARSRRLIEGIVAIARKMDCTMVAEGVEDEEQSLQVLTIGVQYGQGYLFAPPLPLHEALKRV
ncbi:putative bifunctional diguanylate cyclase/phosphodiesterase [Martelella radicis]|uniref:Diguanylate cyclase (GGDEF)-like protein/PAS domain S-box-containing protein n=1 Tax=Martelella radicis TaxID=1397476 RepID=A0A7W6P9K6_9HYPH|nr:GGDEF domain-containing protein [Martelella radicis]MBB4121481.1 diguanylate cyclase (GGDEF)-like protein/PAS domain S-box-containing protein [Martelella radicis]